MATLRDITLKNSVNIGYDPTTKNVTVGQKVYTPNELKQQGLSLTGGSWTGDDMAIKKIIEANQTPTVVPAPEKVTSATTPQAPPATTQTGDIARMITDQLASLTESQLANLRNKIAQGVSTQQQIIKNAPIVS